MGNLLFLAKATAIAVIVGGFKMVLLVLKARSLRQRWVGLLVPRRQTQQVRSAFAVSFKRRKTLPPTALSSYEKAR
jgi:hypothetical protein